MPRAPPDEAVLISGIPLQGHCSSGFSAGQKVVLLQEAQNLSLDVITMANCHDRVEIHNRTLIAGFQYNVPDMYTTAVRII